MKARFLAVAIGVGLVLGLAGLARVASAESREKPKSARATATFGAGCFWSIEAVFERIPGVTSVVSGFAGGTVSFPSYQAVRTGLTGHAEVVQVEYDPDRVSYEDLLKVFWKAHDPTTPNRQGDDFGTQYRSLIVYHTEEQKDAALASYRDLTARHVFRTPIVTALVPFASFYPAEPYHQNYYRHHRDSEYSLVYIVPKLRKLKLGKTAPRPPLKAGRDGENPLPGAPTPRTDGA